MYRIKHKYVTISMRNVYRQVFFFGRTKLIVLFHSIPKKLEAFYFQRNVVDPIKVIG